MAEYPMEENTMTQQTLQDSIHDWQSEEGQTDATMIAGQLEVLTEAVQALFHEQRTANLIAMYTDGAHGAVPEIDYAALVKVIRERLGLQ